MSSALNSAAPQCPHQLRRRVPLPVHPDLLPYRVAPPVPPRPRCPSFTGRRPGRNGLVTHVDRHPPRRILNNPPHQRLLPGNTGGKVDDFPLVFRSKRTGNRQQVRRFQQRRLPPGVGPRQHHHPRRQLQFQLQEATEVGQAKFRQVRQVHHPPVLKRPVPTLPTSPRPRSPDWTRSTPPVPPTTPSPAKLAPAYQMPPTRARPGPPRSVLFQLPPPTHPGSPSANPGATPAHHRPPRPSSVRPEPVEGSPRPTICHPERSEGPKIPAPYNPRPPSTLRTNHAAG